MQNGGQPKGRLKPLKGKEAELKNTPTDITIPERTVPLEDILKYYVEKTGSVLEDYFSDPKLQGDKRFRPSLVINKQLSDVYIDSYNRYKKDTEGAKNIMSFPQYMMKKELMEIANEHGADLGATESTMMWPSLNEDGTISLYDFEKIDDIIWKKGRKAQQLSDLGLGSEEDLNTQFGQQFYNHTVAYNDRVQRYIAEMFNEGKFLKKDIIDALTKRGLGYPKYLDIDFGKDISFMQNQLYEFHKANFDKVQAELAENMQAKKKQEKAAIDLSVEKAYYDKKLWEGQDNNRPAYYPAGNTNLNFTSIEEKMEEDAQWYEDNKTTISSPGYKPLKLKTDYDDADWEEAGYMKVGNKWVSPDQFLQETGKLEMKQIADIKKTLKDNPYALLGFAQTEDELEFLRDLIETPGSWKERELTNKERNILRDNQNIKGFFEFVTGDNRSTEEVLKLINNPEELYKTGLQLNPSYEDMTSVTLREQHRQLKQKKEEAIANKNYDLLPEIRQAQDQLNELSAQDKIDNPNYYKNQVGVKFSNVFNTTNMHSGATQGFYPEWLFMGGANSIANLGANLGFKALRATPRVAWNAGKGAWKWLHRPVFNAFARTPGLRGALGRSLATPMTGINAHFMYHTFKPDGYLHQGYKDFTNTDLKWNEWDKWNDATWGTLGAFSAYRPLKYAFAGGRRFANLPYEAGKLKGIMPQRATETYFQMPSLLQKISGNRYGKPIEFFAGSRNEFMIPQKFKDYSEYFSNIGKAADKVKASHPNKSYKTITGKIKERPAEDKYFSIFGRDSIFGKRLKLQSAYDPEKLVGSGMYSIPYKSKYWESPFHVPSPLNFVSKDGQTMFLRNIYPAGSKFQRRFTSPTSPTKNLELPLPKPKVTGTTLKNPGTPMKEGETIYDNLPKHQTKGQVALEGAKEVKEIVPKIIPYVTETINALSKAGKYVSQANRVSKTVGGLQYINKGLLNAGIDVSDKKAVENFIINEIKKPEFANIDFTKILQRDPQVKQGRMKSDSTFKIKAQEETVPMYRVQPSNLKFFQGANNYTNIFNKPLKGLEHFQLDMPYRGDFPLYPKKRMEHLDFSEYPMDGSAVSGSDYERPFFLDHINFGNYFARPKTLDFPEGYSTIPSLIEAPGLSVNPWNNEIVKIEVPKLHIESYRGKASGESSFNSIKKDKFGRDVYLPDDAINPGEYVVPFWNKYFTEARQIPDPKKDPEGYKKLIDNPFFSFGIHALTGYGAASQQKETEDKIKAGLLGSFGLKKISPSTIKFFSRMAGTTKSAVNAVKPTTERLLQLLTSKDAFKYRRVLSNIERELKPLKTETDDFYQFINNTTLGQQIKLNLEMLNTKIGEIEMGSPSTTAGYGAKDFKKDPEFLEAKSKRDLFGSSNIWTKTSETDLNPTDFFTRAEIQELGGEDLVKRSLKLISGALKKEGEAYTGKVSKINPSWGSAYMRELTHNYGLPLWALEKLGKVKDVRQEQKSTIFVPTKTFFKNLKNNIKELKKALDSDKIEVKDLSFRGIEDASYSLKAQNAKANFLLKNKVTEGLIQLEGYKLSKNLYDFNKTFDDLINNKIKEVKAMQTKLSDKNFNEITLGEQDEIRAKFEIYQGYIKALDQMKVYKQGAEGAILNDLKNLQESNPADVTEADLKKYFGDDWFLERELMEKTFMQGFDNLNRTLAKQTEKISSNLESLINEFEGGISMKEIGKYKITEEGLALENPSAKVLYEDQNIEHASFKTGQVKKYDPSTGEYVTLNLSAPLSSEQFVFNPETNKIKRVFQDGTSKTKDDLKLLEITTSNLNTINSETGALGYGSALYPQLGITTVPGDIDVVISDIDFAKNVIGNPNLEKTGAYSIDGWEDISDAHTFLGNSKYGEAEYDFNIVHTMKGADGKLYLDLTSNRRGDRSLELELIKQFFPDEWIKAQENLLKKYIATGKPINKLDFKQQLNDLDIKITLDEFNKRFDPELKTIIDAYSGSKGKNVARIDELIVRGDVEKIAKGQQAFLNSIGGSGVFKLKTYDESVFKNVSENLRLLEDMGYTATYYKNAANNPKRMNLLVNDYIINNSILSRYIDYVPREHRSIENLFNAMGLEAWSPEINQGGSRAGEGTNFTLFGDPDHPGNIFGNVILNNNKLNKMNDPFKTVKFLKDRRDGDRDLTEEELEKIYSAVAKSYKAFAKDLTIEELTGKIKTTWQEDKKELRGNAVTKLKDLIDFYKMDISRIPGVDTSPRPNQVDTYANINKVRKQLALNIREALDTKAISRGPYGNSLYTGLLGILNTDKLKLPNQNAIELSEDLITIGIVKHLEASQSLQLRKEKIQMKERGLINKSEEPMSLEEVSRQLDPLSPYNIEKWNNKTRYRYTGNRDEMHPINDQDIVNAFKYLEENINTGFKKTLSQLKPYENALSKILNTENIDLTNSEVLAKVIEEIELLEAKTIQLEKSKAEILEKVKPHLAELVMLQQKETQWRNVGMSYTKLKRVGNTLAITGGVSGIIGSGLYMLNKEMTQDKIEDEEKSIESFKKITNESDRAYAPEAESIFRTLSLLKSAAGRKVRDGKGAQEDINLYKQNLKKYLEQYPELENDPYIRRVLDSPTYKKHIGSFKEGGQFIEMELNEDELEKMIEGGYRIEEID